MIILKNIPDLAERLIYIRKIKGLTQSDLARMGKTTQQSIQQAETGLARNPRYLTRLAKALDIPIEWLALNERPRSLTAKGLSEREDDVLSSFHAMPKKDQSLILELMKSRRKK